MAKNSFLVFDEQGTNIMSDAEYQSASQRISGVVPGLAEPEMHNKLYRQATIMGAAIGKVLVEAGYDASDANMTALAANIKALFVSKPLDAYPVGAIYISTSAINPAQLFGGTWEQIQGRFLLAAGGGYTAGATGGAATHTLTANEMPSHSHTITVNNGGAHTHIASSNTTGNHTHTRGSMNITGYFGADDRASNYTSGAFSSFTQTEVNTSADGGDSHWHAINFEAARSWTGETSANGSHSHAITVNSGGTHNHTASAANTGGGQAHNNMPPYLAVYVWKRTA